MNALKIGIVEDDLIIATSLTEMLRACGYTVTRPAKRYTEAIAMIEDEQPDLLLLDVRIQGTLDGVAVAETVNTQFQIPFIFLTANSDFTTINRAKAVKPAAFLSKPVTQAQLFAAIEIAAAAVNGTSTPALPAVVGEHQPPPAWPASAPAPEYLFVKEGASFRKIVLGDILYAESDQNYVRLQLSGKRRMLVRMTLADFAAQLPDARFVRVHRSYVVCLPCIAEATQEEVVLDDGQRLPLSRSYRDALLQRLGIER